MAKSLTPVVIVLALLLVGSFVAACATQSTRNSGDPFDDPFFERGFAAGDSLDDFLSEPAPSVGWLSRDGEQTPEDRLIRLHGDPIWEEGEQPEAGLLPDEERPFVERAQEATLATLSVLVGVGMAALPFLIGAL